MLEEKIQILDFEELSEELKKKVPDYLQLVVDECNNPLTKKRLYAECLDPESLWAEEIEPLKKELDQAYPLTLEPKNWEFKDYEKGFFESRIERWSFNCGPLDDQLRAYVSERDGKIVEVEVRWE